MAFTIFVKGLGNVEITNWDQIEKDLATAIAAQIVPAIREEIRRMKLVDSSDFWQSIDFEVQDDGVLIYSTAPYAIYLEYGTYAYYVKYGVDNFPEKGDPKKKDLAPKDRKKYPKGMQPFAPFRRVLYNQAKMEEFVQKAADFLAKK